MAKINHHNFIDTINDVLGEAKDRKVLRLEFEGNNWKGDKLTIGKQELINFGTCGYMGLENHPKLIEKTIEYTQQYGTQFSVSRTYLTDKKSFLLEGLLQQIFFNHPVISFTSTSMAHISVLPIVVGHNDAIILDQQAHISIATAAQLMSPKGVPISIIRHSNLEMLEHKIKQLRNKHEKIWYMIDGVYSMYGDIAPIDQINQLMKKYEQLHLYVDDAHGMSWHGENGSGRIFKEASLNKRTIYITTMAKGYGAMGGIAVFPNQKLHEKVLLHGGPLSYSHPIPPPMLGAAIASAEIHLSQEINEIQSSLNSKLKYTSSLLECTDLPVLSHPGTPIYYIGTGQPVVGYNLNKRILDEGFYVTLGIFPGVPIKNTGLRFTLTNHNTKKQIKDFIDAIVYHYPKALEEEGKTYNDVRKAFKLPLSEEKEVRSTNQKLTLIVKRTIKEIDRDLWNKHFKNKGNYDWEALVTMEESFSGNSLPEENWDFYYMLIKDQKDDLLLATYFTVGLFKDDLVSPLEISLIIEEQRKTNPYYLCSKGIMMGSLFSEGDHLFVDHTNKYWEDGIRMMIQHLYELQTSLKCNSIFLRDFDESDERYAKLFHDLGFFKLNMPNSNVISELDKDLDKNYLELLSYKNRKNIRQDVIKHFNDFEVKSTPKLTKEEADTLYDLYLNVANQNFSINIFKYPKKLFESFNNNENWEFLILKNSLKKIVSIICCYKGTSSYFPVVIGIDYKNNSLQSPYKQLVYRTVIHARKSGFKHLFFGISADTEKRKVGAVQIKKVAYVNLVDQYNMELIDRMSV